MGGIEPPSTVYETVALPLSYMGKMCSLPLPVRRKTHPAERVSLKAEAKAARLR